MVFAQSVDKLAADLRNLSSPQLADDILAQAEPNAQPSRRVVMDFTDELMRALAGKTRRPEDVSQLSTAIVDVLHSSGVVTRKYRATIDSVRQSLQAMGVTEAAAQRVAGRLMVVGQEVRGPEDLPVSAPRFLK